MSQIQREQIGQKIKTARIAKKLTTSQVSSKVGQHFSVIEKLERGELSQVNDSMLEDICKLLEIDKL